MSKSELDKFKLHYEVLDNDPIKNIKSYLAARLLLRQRKAKKHQTPSAS